MQITRGYSTIWAATLLFFASFYALLVLLPQYLASIGMADWQIGLVLGAFGIASLIGRPIVGISGLYSGAALIVALILFLTPRLERDTQPQPA